MASERVTIRGMPIYEYRCRTCGKQFEVLQGMGDGADGLVCPDCGHSEVEKQFSTFASGSTESSTGFSASGAPTGCGGSGFS